MERHFVTRRCIKVDIKTEKVEGSGRVEQAVLLALDDEVFPLSPADAQRIGESLEDAAREILR